MTPDNGCEPALCRQGCPPIYKRPRLRAAGTAIGADMEMPVIQEIG